MSALDVGLLVAALAVIVGTAAKHDFSLPDWNTFSIVALASVPVLIRYGMVIESAAGALRASTAPAVLFAYDLDHPLVFLPVWAVVVLLSHLVLFDTGRSIGRGSIEVLGGATMVAVSRSIDTVLWPVDRAVTAAVVYTLTLVTLELLRVGVRHIDRVVGGVRRADAGLAFGGLVLACCVVAMLREAYTHDPHLITGLLGAACLATFVVGQILLARLQASVRGVDALAAAGQAMPWPADQIENTLAGFARSAIRAQDARTQPSSGSGPGQLSIALHEHGYLVVERVRGDLPFTRADARLLSALAGLSDTSRAHALKEEQLRHQATTDDLTGLPTYPHFRQRVERLGNARGGQRRIVVVFLDLDGLEPLDTELGHLDTDLVLSALGTRLRTGLPENVEMCRFGGDEFILLTVLDSDAAVEELDARVRSLVEEPQAIGDQVMQVSASLGVAASRDPHELIDAVIRRAESAMRAARDARPRVQAEAQSEVIARLLSDDGFAVVLQPLVAAKSGELEAVEALVRVEDQVFGRLSPVLVVGSAQRSSLLDEVTEVVARRAIDAVRQVEALVGRRITLLVNIEFAQLRSDSGLLATLRELVRIHGIELVLEVSERAFEDWTDDHRATAEELRDAGIGLAIDDYGAGYATYSLLTQWPWDLVKIDRDIVATDTPAGRRLLVHVTDLLVDLGFPVVAEGVEDAEQRAFASGSGVWLLQGWAVARPLTSEALLERLRAGTSF
ncbi:hypothetical protein ASE01_09050 [Nocardioides sp. Root190]|nr:hypothetical protein ASE01_09050 [Nocardioides sp. Root190]